MSSEIDRFGKMVRPSFRHNDMGHAYNNQEVIAQLAESSRNVLEEIARSQMLQCDVARAIKAMLRELKGLRRDLRKLQGWKP